MSVTIYSKEMFSKMIVLLEYLLFLWFVNLSGKIF